MKPESDDSAVWIGVGRENKIQPTPAAARPDYLLSIQTIMLFWVEC
jgi:hypothetical protein